MHYWHFNMQRSLLKREGISIIQWVFGSYIYFFSFLIFFFSFFLTWKIHRTVIRIFPFQHPAHFDRKYTPLSGRCVLVRINISYLATEKKIMKIKIKCKNTSQAKHMNLINIINLKMKITDWINKWIISIRLVCGTDHTLFFNV